MAGFSSEAHGLLSERIRLALKRRFEGDSSFSMPAKFNFSSKGAYATFSTNLFPRDKADARKIYLEARVVVKTAIEEHIGEDGEIIEYEVSEGRILDGGRVWFYVLEGFIVEAYCFTCKSISFARVLHERDPRKGDEWVSVDVDENLDTPWFNES
ncbi:MAG: hypothetical protein QXF77_01670 [Candidatus Jordarchaeales archaeon]